LRRAVGNGYRAGRLHVSVGPGGCAGADEGKNSRDCGEKHPHDRSAYRPAYRPAPPVVAARVFNRPMLSLAEISDRLEIQQLLVDYSSAIDNRRFDDLDAVFTQDAYIDYTALGGIEGRYPEVKAWLAEVLPNFPMYSHMLGNFSVRIDGDTAASRTICFNPMVLGGDKEQVMFCGLWYDDEFVRTPEGWRMTRRVETKCFQKIL
jgi:SnoaL-like domain